MLETGLDEFPGSRSLRTFLALALHAQGDPTRRSASCSRCWSTRCRRPISSCSGRPCGSARRASSRRTAPPDPAGMHRTSSLGMRSAARRPRADPRTYPRAHAAPSPPLAAGRRRPRGGRRGRRRPARRRRDAARSADEVGAAGAGARREGEGHRRASAAPSRRPPTSACRRSRRPARAPARAPPPRSTSSPGTHTAKVEVAGASKARIAVLDSSAERDVIRDGRSVWVWNSKTSTRHARDRLRRRRREAGRRGARRRRPAALAQELLAKVDGTTAVSVDPAQPVAGPRRLHARAHAEDDRHDDRLGPDRGRRARPACRSTCRCIARGATSPAFETGFTDISYAVPAASTFDFTPPSDAKVTTKTLTPGDRPEGARAAGSAHEADGHRIGLVLDRRRSPAGAVPSDLASNPTVSRLTTAVAGGRVLHTALVNVLLTDRRARARRRGAGVARSSPPRGEHRTRDRDRGPREAVPRPGRGRRRRARGAGGQRLRLPRPQRVGQDDDDPDAARAS